MRLPLLSAALALALLPVTALAVDVKTMTVTSVEMSSDYQTATITLSQDPGEKVHIRSEFYLEDFDSLFGGGGWPMEERIMILGGFQDEFVHATPGSQVRLVFRVCPYDEPYTGKHVDEYCGEPTTVYVTYRPFASFPDVRGDHENAAAIAYVRLQAIVSGYPDGTYRPDDTINRAEFAKILTISRFGQEMIDMCGSTGQFPDVRASDWFVKYVCRAKDAGLVDGYPDGTFRPGNPINFVEAAKIIARSRTFNSSDPELPPLMPGDPWFRPYVDFLAARAAIPMSIERLDQSITRGEMAEMIWRLHAGITDLPTKTYASFEEEIYTDGWTSYENAEDGFGIDLPQGWLVEERVLLGATFIGNYEGTSISTNGGYERVFVASEPECPDLSRIEWAQPTSVTLNGHSFATVAWQDGAAGSVGEEQYFVSQIEPGRCLIVASYYFHTTGEAYDEPERTRVKEGIAAERKILERILQSLRIH